MTEHFTYEGRSFFREGKPFYPEEGNTQSIVLPAFLQSELDFASAKEIATAAIAAGKTLLWEFDFGLSRDALHLHDTVRFLSFTLAIEEFLKGLWPQFEESSFGIVLYRGKLDFSKRFFWAGEHEKNLQELGQDEDLYCADVFAEYIHRLASYLPDALLPFCLFDVSDLSPARSAQILSKERFAHVYLGVRGSPFSLGHLIWQGEESLSLCQETQVGVILPPDELCSSSCLERLNLVLGDLISQGKCPRVIPEALLNQEWDNLDLVIGLEDLLTFQGRRRLQGFIAAGGDVSLI